MKSTYMVVLVDRDTGQDQRILVRSDRSDAPDRMQGFVDSLDDLEISNPVVQRIVRLATKRPLPKTTLASFTA